MGHEDRFFVGYDKDFSDAWDRCKDRIASNEKKYCYDCAYYQMFKKHTNCTEGKKPKKLCEGQIACNKFKQKRRLL